MEKDEFKMRYCPFCGMEKQDYDNTVCRWCGNEMQMFEALHGRNYYWERANDIYHRDDHKVATEEEIHSILLEEARQNPQFDEKLAEECFKKWRKWADEENKKSSARKLEKQKQANVPKCPTCGSTDVVKISTASKVVGGAMFGLFSKTARSQFKCNNCGYKW